MAARELLVRIAKSGRKPISITSLRHEALWLLRNLPEEEELLVLVQEGLGVELDRQLMPPIESPEHLTDQGPRA
jgi:hypothetical protein